VLAFVFARLGDPRGLATIKADAAATDGRVCVTEQYAPRGAGSPLHIHHREDEWFYVLEGELTFWVGGRVITAAAGAFVYGPRDVAHTFVVSSETARFLPGEAKSYTKSMESVGKYANFVFENETLLRQPPENYEPLGLTQNAGVGDFNDTRSKNEDACNCTPMRGRRRWLRGQGDSPNTLTRPPSASRSPSMISRVVVFPAPFGPRMPKNSPSWTSNVTPSTAVTSP